MVDRQERNASGEQPMEAHAARRRSFLATGSGVLMVGGLVAGYGSFAVMAGQYLFPRHERRSWLFVTRAEDVAPGGSVSFESPSGVRVTITRRVDDSAYTPPSVSSFLALSSVCPHLGCRVHWEPQKGRFYCPCHNGEFTPEGEAVSGPPAAAGQHLPRYPLQIVDGALYIEMPSEAIT